MTDYWRFGAAERIILLAVLLTQWILVALLTSIIMKQHGDPPATFWGNFELFSWLIIGGLTISILAIPAARVLSAEVPRAYRYLKTKVKS